MMTVLEPVPTADDVETLLGHTLDNSQRETAEGHLRAAKAVVREYTRGRGFSPDAASATASINSVILGLAMRSYNNPTADSFMAAGSLTRRPGMPELLLLDRLTLNNYRVSTF